MDRHEPIPFSDFEERFAQKLGETDFNTAVDFYQLFVRVFTWRHTYIFIELLEMALEAKAIKEVFDHLDSYLDSFARQRTLCEEESGTDNDPSIRQLGIIIEVICSIKAPQQKPLLSAAE